MFVSIEIPLNHYFNRTTTRNFKYEIFIYKTNKFSSIFHPYNISIQNIQLYELLKHVAQRIILTDCFTQVSLKYFIIEYVLVLLEIVRKNEFKHRNKKKLKKN